MTSTSKPTLLWVHGAWHTTEYLQPTVALLDAAGYTNVCVQLPSVGADPPLLSADDDVATIRKALVEILDKKEQMVVIIMHSYGGIPGTSAAAGFAQAARRANGKKTWVSHLCYVSAYMGCKGTSANSVHGVKEGDPPAPFMHIRTDLKEGGGLGADILHAQQLLYHDLEEEDQKTCLKELRHHSIYAFASPVTADAIFEIPSSYLLTTEDVILPLGLQEDMLAKARSPHHEEIFKHVERIPSGHTPFVGKHSKAVCDFVRRATGEDVPM